MDLNHRSPGSVRLAQTAYNSLLVRACCADRTRIQAFSAGFEIIGGDRSTEQRVLAPLISFLSPISISAEFRLRLIRIDGVAAEK